MDVQGSELKVLAGSELFLDKIKVIWSEVSNIRLYKNQPIRTEIVTFMKENGFILCKSSMEGQTGDQMYLNER